MSLLVPGDSCQSDKPVLNCDIFLQIMSILPPKDLLSFMCTCRTLYDAGMPLHLATMVPPLVVPASISSLCDALLAHPARLQLLKTLRLNSHAVENVQAPTEADREVIAKLARVLSQASQLKTLDFDDAEYILGWDKSLGTAISSLPSLTHLSISEIGPLTRDVLGVMRSPVSFFSADFSSVRDLGGDQDVADPVDYIEGFKDTLTEIDVSYAIFRRNDIQFPNVHTVQLGISYDTDAAALACCFPNIRTLLLHSRGHININHIEMLRHRNLSAFQGAWTSLDVLKSGLNYAYILGLRIQHRIRTWRGLRVKVQSDQKRRFHTLLNDFRPLHLSTRVSLTTLINLGDLFPAGSSITHLRFRMNVSHSAVDMDSMTETYLTWASNLQLKLLEIHVEYQRPEWAPSVPLDASGLDPTPSTPIKSYLLAWDLEAFVRRLALVSPGLCHVFVYCRGIQRPPSLWAITREGSDIQLRPILELEARKVGEDVGFLGSS